MILATPLSYHAFVTIQSLLWSRWADYVVVLYFPSSCWPLWSLWMERTALEALLSEIAHYEIKYPGSR